MALFLLNTFLQKRKNLFALSEEHRFRYFTTILDEANDIPLKKTRDGNMMLTQSFFHNNKKLSLTVSSVTLQTGKADKPRLIYIPWYGGKSNDAKKFLSILNHEGWTHEGIEIFSSLEAFNVILSSAMGSLYAYALGMRMIHERIHEAHSHHQPVSLIGISYGANLMSTFLTQAKELPDAIIEIEGGSILQTTLESPYRHKSDPLMIKATEENEQFVPRQLPLSPTVAARTLAIINLQDKIVLGQEAMYGNAIAKLYIKGSHIIAPIMQRKKIRKLATEHLQKLLDV